MNIATKKLFMATGLATAAGSVLNLAERKRSLLENAEKNHIKARSKHPAYPERTAVPDNMVSWKNTFPGYQPTEFTHSVVLKATFKKGDDASKKWADPQDPKTVKDEYKDYPEYQEFNAGKRFSHEGTYFLDKTGKPINPRGRTGMSERGLLGKWGPNHAADPVVTRRDPDKPFTGNLELVAIKRGDTGEWALPGGMVDPGEAVSATVKREFTEEAGNLKGAARERFTNACDQLFRNGEVVYKGYVDDPRNTDNAWMETVAMHYHLPHKLARQLPLAAGDDAAKVRWVPFDGPDFKEPLYADHARFLAPIKAAEGRRAEWWHGNNAFGHHMDS